MKRFLPFVLIGSAITALIMFMRRRGAVASMPKIVTETLSHTDIEVWSVVSPYSSSAWGKEGRPWTTVVKKAINPICSVKDTMTHKWVSESAKAIIKASPDIQNFLALEIIRVGGGLRNITLKKVGTANRLLVTVILRTEKYTQHFREIIAVPVIKV